MTSSFYPFAQKPEAGCIVHLSGTIKVLGMDDDHKTWEIQKVSEEQKDGDNAPRTYLKLKSIDHFEGLRFVTVPYDADIMRVFAAPDKTVKPTANFPQPGSQVLIDNQDEQDSFARARNGLWQVDKSSYVPREDGSGQDLKLQLSSINRKHPAFMNVVFNEKSMKPILLKPTEAEIKNVHIDHDVTVIKPLNIRKRNAPP